MRDIPAAYGPFGLNWGYASSPLLHGDALYVQVLHGMRTDDPSYVLRIDRGTGETVWRVERPTEAVRESPDSYTTPALLEYDGGTEIVITGGDAVTGHDPETGRELWRADGLAAGPDVPPGSARPGATRIFRTALVVEALEMGRGATAARCGHSSLRPRLPVSAPVPTGTVVKATSEFPVALDPTLNLSRAAASRRPQPRPHAKARNAMRTVRPLVVAVLAVVVLAVPAVVLADGRVALVVGNSTYAHIGRLPNPANDAADVAAASGDWASR